ATSTGVECVFSQGRQLLHFTRNRLSAKSVQMFLCLGSWSKHDLVGDQVFHAAVRENMGEKKGKGKIVDGSGSE
ncbi:hypothetical protein B0H16DRAFT_1302414, partial [Mycena metata]